jgi:ankyrin repeat domain-containing protein 50
MTPLMWASWNGHVGVVQWLLDQGAAIDTREQWGGTALITACCEGCLAVVRLLMERGADPTISTEAGRTPLMFASRDGHLEVVRFLLGHPSAKATINRRSEDGVTALWWACYWGRPGEARALLESGADPTIAKDDGITPMAITKQGYDVYAGDDISVEGRRECVVALEVRSRRFFPSADQLADA